MNGSKDTIFALSTAAGKAAIAVFRISGKDTFKILKKISSNKVQIRFLKNSGHRLSNNVELKIISNAIDNILDLI